MNLTIGNDDIFFKIVFMVGKGMNKSNYRVKIGNGVFIQKNIQMRFAFQTRFVNLSLFCKDITKKHISYSIIAENLVEHENAMRR